MLDLNRLPDAVRYEGGVSRRLFLAYGAALAALPALASRTSAADKKPTFAADPFSLGVASGDPEATSVVIWTKLAPQPLEPDGGLGPDQKIAVDWEVAEDDKFQTVVSAGWTIATAELGHSIHVEVPGLKPDRWYWYRFHAGDATSPTGRTRTMPAADALPTQLKLTIASCQGWEAGYFTAYEQMARDGVDLVFFLGDYIYEYPTRPKAIRQHNGPKETKIATLADYRQRHMLYRSDKQLQQMHAQCPWFVTWDDHEVDNNYADDIQELKSGKVQSTPAEFLVRRAAAYRAYYEMMPLRARSLPNGPDMLLYRKASFGKLAELFVLDTRQYRSDQPNGDGVKPIDKEALNPQNTMLGAKQRDWLQAGLAASPGRWNVLAQQVMMGLMEPQVAKPDAYAMDKWPGAATERIELVKFMADRKVSNPIVLTGDIHTNWANELRVDDRQPKQPVVAAEFVCTSISSGGNGSAKFADLDKLYAANPGVKFHNRERGYVRCTVTPEKWQSDFVVVSDVEKPGGKCSTRASFVVEAGRAKVEKA